MPPSPLVEFLQSLSLCGVAAGIVISLVLLVVSAVNRVFINPLLPLIFTAGAGGLLWVAYSVPEAKSLMMFLAPLSALEALLITREAFLREFRSMQGVPMKKGSSVFRG